MITKYGRRAGWVRPGLLGGWVLKRTESEVQGNRKVFLALGWMILYTLVKNMHQSVY